MLQQRPGSSPLDLPPEQVAVWWFEPATGQVGYNLPRGEQAFGPAVQALLADIPALLQRLETAPAAGPLVTEGWVVTPRGERWLQHHLFATRDKTGRVSRVDGVSVDVSMHRWAVERLRREAQRDPVTGLPNRAQAVDELQAWAVAARRAGQPLALVVLDLNGFRGVNQGLGYEAGDEVLRQFGARLAQAAPLNARVARLGGDQYCVVAPRTGEAEAGALAMKLLAVTEEPFSVGGLEVPLGASAGVAVFPKDGTSADELLRLATAALSEAKASRTAYALAVADPDRPPESWLTLAQELHRAIGEDELVLHYQPVVDPYTHAVDRLEALVRWQHPKHGLIAPGAFIPLAERTGLVRPLTLWVLERALAQLAAWDTAGVNLAVSVNVAVQHLQDARLTTDVAAALGRWGVAPERLCLEVTEQGLVTNLASIAPTTRALRDLGVGVAIDDFGTGYAAMGYLRGLSACQVKIDRSFVADARHDKWDAAFVRSVIEMAGALGKQVVAEGVEDAETLALLRAAGCDAVQGYYLSPPVPAEAVLPLVTAIEAGWQAGAEGVA